MREILFKAKGQTSGKWYEGLLTRLDPDVCRIEDRHREGWICDPDTICEYTGLTDRNGQKIWENDICIIRSSNIDEEDGYFTVGWDDDGAKFTLSGNRLIVDFDNFYGHECEVAGNVFDNPELVGGGAE